VAATAETECGKIEKLITVSDEVNEKHDFTGDTLHLIVCQVIFFVQVTQENYGRQCLISVSSQRWRTLT
jgi:hypothetical protein